MAAGKLRWVARLIGTWVLLSACLGITVWGAFALWFQAPGSQAVRYLQIALWVALGLLAVWAAVRPTRRWAWLGGFALAFAVLLGYWSTITPRQHRDWADDVAQPLRARLQGDTLVLENVRNFHWRSETDYDVRWESRRYRLDQVRSVDMVLSYWMGPAIAHTLMSFGFEDGRQLVFSLEIRKERHESFSAVGGFFRQFEVVLVASDERDIVQVRSNARGEDVYLYRLHGLSQADLQALLRAYVAQAQALERAPQFYNTLTSNCTTVVFDLMRRIAPRLPLDYRLLLSGYLAEYAHDVGGLVPGYDYTELQRRGRITERARAVGDTPDFSRAIRRRVPGIPEGATP